MSDNHIRFNNPDPRIVGYYVLETSAPSLPDPRFFSLAVSYVQLAMYKKPCWFHRTMMRLCFNIVWRENKP